MFPVRRYDPEDLEWPDPIAEYAVNFPELATQCVLFLGNKEKIGHTDRERFRPRATAFVVSVHDGALSFTYVVTAEHCIAGFAEKRWEIWVRSNLKDGNAQEEKWEAPKWWVHPDESGDRVHDIAVAPIVFSDKEQFLAVPLNGPQGIAGTAQILAANEIGVGDEVAITGLFKSHFGRQKNIPIIRIGNIAMMRGEPVYTKYRNGLIDAYLIEARSIGGLSGSPVFVNVAPVRVVSDDIVPSIGTRIFLLGLMQGHFDIRDMKEDVVSDSDDVQQPSINTGIGVVVPVEEIIETLNQEELVDMRRQLRV